MVAITYFGGECLSPSETLALAKNLNQLCNEHGIKPCWQCDEKEQIIVGVCFGYVETFIAGRIVEENKRLWSIDSIEGIGEHVEYVGPNTCDNNSEHFAVYASLWRSLVRKEAKSES